ncbi:DUF5640 domain-containing protein [Lentisalinibacter sediminis]|uniref:DUF5640 domain-containing protein n=1 Tax=Lentisalinibacter sediminis TaxID=2992237 RepID=UPI00386E0534
MKRALTTLCLLLSLGTGGCRDAAISGTWQDRQAETTYQFRDDGRVTVSVLDASVPAEYTVDGDRVLVTSPQGTVVLKKREDRLYGPMGQELVRQAD